MSAILVLNCGSSSVKFAVIACQSEQTLLQGVVESIATDNATIISRDVSQQKQSRPLGKIDYVQALDEVFRLIQQQSDGEIIGVGHRVVHGGEQFKESSIINEQVIAAIEDCATLAPLHNPVNLLGIEIASQTFANLPQVAVFDTSFHQSMPDFAFMYPIPYKLYQSQHLRRYGFHGTSHRFVTQRAAEILGKPYKDCAFISAHLGNGCSLAAVKHGYSVDTSMGLTPLEGLMMGTRSGDVDPGLISFLIDQLNMSAHEVDQLLNKQSGLLGVSELSMDMRQIIAQMQQGNQQAQLAFEMFCYRLAKYIAAYLVPLGKLDALIFTGGIGENSAEVRERVLQWLQVVGFAYDAQHNSQHGQNNQFRISKQDSQVALVVATNEEAMIARDTYQLIHQ